MSKDKPQVLPDHNGKVSQVVVTDFVRELAKLEKQLDAIKDKQKILKKKATDDGVDVKTLIEAVKESQQDPAVLIEQHNNRTLYLRYLRAPLGTQLQMIEDRVDASTLTEEQRNKNWRNDGYRAGLAAENRDKNPHDPNSEAGRQWDEGYQDGQGENLAKITDGKGGKAAKGEVVPIGRGRKGASKANDPGPSDKPANEQVEEDSDKPPVAPADDAFDSGGKLQTSN